MSIFGKTSGYCHARSARKHRRRGDSVEFVVLTKYGHSLYRWQR